MIKNKQIPSLISLVCLIVFFSFNIACSYEVLYFFDSFLILLTGWLPPFTTPITFLLGGIIVYAGFVINGISIIVFVTRYIINIVRQKKCSSAEIFEVNNPNFKQIFKNDLYGVITFIIGLILIIYTCGESFYFETYRVDPKGYLYVTLFILIGIIIKNLVEILVLKRKQFSWYVIVSHFLEIIFSATMIITIDNQQDRAINFYNGYLNDNWIVLYDLNLSYALFAFIYLSIIITIGALVYSSIPKTTQIEKTNVNKK